MPTTEVHLRFEVIDSGGLHLRHAARFAGLAACYLAEIRVRHQATDADGKSAIELLMLAAPHGAQLEIEVRGADTEEAVAALSALVTEWASAKDQGLAG